MEMLKSVLLGRHSFVYTGNFADGALAKKMLAHCVSDYSTNTTQYYIGEDEVSEEERTEWMESLSDASECERYEFTDENIDKYITD